MARSLGSLVCTLTKLPRLLAMIEIQVLAGAVMGLSFCHHFQTGSEAQPASYQMGIMVSYP
jgi:hypothetical protein